MTDYDTTIERLTQALYRLAQNASTLDAHAACFDAARMVTQLSSFELDCRPGKCSRGNYSTRRAQVYINGVELSHCVAADTERGIALVYRLDPQGRPVLQGDTPITDTLCGDVEITTV